MLKQCTALFLLVATLASSFSKAFVVVDFYANQDCIAKNLCINKDKPMMHCHGRCQLCKRLAHEENQDKNNPERRSENRNDVVFCDDDHSDLLTAPVPVELTLTYPVMTDRAPVDRTFSIFHPPGC